MRTKGTDRASRATTSRKNTAPAPATKRTAAPAAKSAKASTFSPARSLPVAFGLDGGGTVSAPAGSTWANGNPDWSLHGPGSTRNYAGEGLVPGAIVLQPGDTAFAAAAKSGTWLTDVMAMNRLDDTRARLLQPGQALAVWVTPDSPYALATSSTTAPAQPVRPPPAPPPATITPDMPASTLRPGAAGPNVAWVQARLADYGLLSSASPTDAGDANATFGDATRRAVMAFQQQRGVAVTGVVDLNTRNLLAAPAAKTPAGNVVIRPDFSLAGLSQQQQAEYWSRVFDSMTSGAQRNTAPNGVTLLSVRGFDASAGQPVYNSRLFDLDDTRFNDAVVAIFNDDQGKPARVEVLTASTDYGHRQTMIDKGYGGADANDAWGVLLSQDGRAATMTIGNHIGRSSGNLGIALIDSGNNLAQADSNADGQVDDPANPLSVMGMNMHRNRNTSDGLVGIYSAGCTTFPDDGPYATFAGWLEAARARGATTVTVGLVAGNLLPNP